MLTRCRPARSPALCHTALPDGAKRDNKGATQEEEEGAEHVPPIRSEKGRAVLADRCYAVRVDQTREGLRQLGQD
jgi:hypothetical protein